MKTLAASLAILLVIAGFVWINFTEGKTPVDGTSEFSDLKTDDEQSPMTQAALSFLEGLTEEQRGEAVFTFDDAERTSFHYTPHPHKGVLWSSLNEEQLGKGIALLKTVLSDYGYEKVRDIMALELILRVVEKRPPNDDYRNPERYYFAVFGTPSDKEPWGWRFEGHHLSFNFSSVAQDLAVTPTFMGNNPAKVLSGPQKGLRTLAQEEDLARLFMSELSTEQEKKAIITTEVPEEIITGIDRKVKLTEPEGLAFKDMNEDQQLILEQLIRVYLDKMKPRIAQNQWQRIQNAGLEKLHFAWAGSLEVGKAHYYRIHGPSFLLEYDNIQNDANHIHTVWRDPTNDFGDDLLKRHYDEDH